MKSVCVTKAKAYYIIADGYTECYTFNSREEAESFIELFKPFYKNKTVMIQEANVFTSYIMADRLDTIPTAEKECDKGHWIDITFDASMCSVCQTTQEYETKYCPECGAKMDGDNNVK